MENTTGYSPANHEAYYEPEGNGFLVICPLGCDLGTSRLQPSVIKASRRAATHHDAVRLLTLKR